MATVRRRPKLPAVLAAALVALAGCGEDDRQAERRDRFVDSIGVNVHTSYTDTPYANQQEVRSALRDLGILHVRDGIVSNREDQYRALRDLARQRIQVNLIMGDPRGRFGTGSVEEQVATLKRRLEGVAHTVEGPNEYDGSGDPAWPRTLRSYQMRLHGLLKGASALARLPLVAPSLVDTSGWRRLGDLRSWLDFGNIHHYPGGRPPATSDIEGQLRLIRPGSGSAPVFVTETGYHNAVNAPVDQHAGVSERAAAIYLPVLLLEHFRLGIRRTFLYELVDERREPGRRDPEQHFGLLRHDLSRKPAFQSIRNLIALAGEAKSVEPSALPFSIRSGAPVRHLLLQDPDGSFRVALWRSGLAVWSPRAKVELRPPPVAVQLQLEQIAERVRLYSPLRSTRPLRSWNRVDSLRLGLGAEPLVLEVQEA